MLRAVYDTNVIISGAFWAGPPRLALAEVIAERVRLLATDMMIAELRITLARPKFQVHAARTGQNLDELVASYTAIIERVVPDVVPSGTVRDPKDVMILACAVGGKADCIVTGDKDLLVLGSYTNIPIWSVIQLLDTLKKTNK